MTEPQEVKARIEGATRIEVESLTFVWMSIALLALAVAVGPGACTEQLMPEEEIAAEEERCAEFCAPDRYMVWRGDCRCREER